MTGKTAIILLNYNSFLDTNECIESILQSKETNFHIIVIDNSSIDDSLKKLQDKFKSNNEIKFIASIKNLGFAGGCNIGIKKALSKGFDYILLLNNDTVVTHNFLSNLKILMNKEENVGIVGGKILFAGNENQIWDAGGFISNISCRGIRRRNNSLGIEKISEVGFITCCMALIKKEVFNVIGLLPEAYFFGTEEWEFSLRATRVGFKLLYNPSSVIYHKVGRSHNNSSKKMLYNTYRNRLLFVKRNYNNIQYYTFLAFFLTFKLLQRSFKKGQLKDLKWITSFILLKRVFWDTIRNDKVTAEQLKNFD